MNPGAEIDFFAFQGWVAAAMFTDAILAAGPSPTRDAVLAELCAPSRSYDAHGLVAPDRPGGEARLAVLHDRDRARAASGGGSTPRAAASAALSDASMLAPN